MKKAIIINKKDFSFLDYPSNDWCLSIYFKGCEHNCIDCSNPQLQNHNVCLLSKEYSVDEFLFLLKEETKKNRTNNIVLIGGDPLYKKNLDFVRYLLNKSGIEYNYCIYTGYNIEYVKKNNIKNFKFIKCEKYNIKLKQNSEKNDKYIQFASKNQKLYNENCHLLSENGRFYFKKGE